MDANLRFRVHANGVISYIKVVIVINFYRLYSKYFSMYCDVFSLLLGNDDRLKFFWHFLRYV